MSMNQTTNTRDPFLVVEDLTVQFPTADGLVSAVNGLSYEVELGRTLGIVGESGSGKSVSSMAIMGLHDPRRTKITGSIRLQGTELVGVDDERMRRIRGNAVSMIFQDPLSSLHPFYTVGDQIAEAYLAHHKASKAEARARAIEPVCRASFGGRRAHSWCGRCGSYARRTLASASDTRRACRAALAARTCLLVAQRAMGSTRRCIVGRARTSRARLLQSGA